MTQQQWDARNERMEREIARYVAQGRSIGGEAVERMLRPKEIETKAARRRLNAVAA